MKKFLKVLGIIAIVAVIAVVGLIGLLLHQLPSAKQVGSYFQTKKNTTAVAPVATNDNTPQKVHVESQGGSESTTAQTTSDSEHILNDEKNSPEQNAKILEDLTSQQRPLANFCGSLRYSKLGSMSGKEFNDSFGADETKPQDARVQALKPILRYVIRLPSLKNLLDEVEAANQSGDESLIDKAAFYSKAVVAYQEMQAHKTDIEALTDRSYLLLGMNNLVATKPEVLNDPRVQKFCGDTETNFNNSIPVDFDREKKDFLDLLSQLGVSAQQIHFDPNYKSQIDINFSGSSLTFRGGWLEDLIKDDKPTHKPTTDKATI